MTDRKCRWGILSTATIARKNWQAIRNTGNATLIAVASRDVERSQRFIDECQSQACYDPAPQAVGSYEELLGRDDIDAVYLPLPTGVRAEWVMRAAAAGKHIMCEKPCGVNAGQVSELLSVCAENDVQFMDGVMFMHSARLAKLREVLDDGKSIGDIKRITMQFSFRAPDEFFRQNIRASSSLEPYGCLGDLGWYTIRFAQWAMRYEMPVSVTGRLLDSVESFDGGEPVPTEFSGELLFAGGASCGFYCSFMTENQQLASVSGTQGHLIVSDYVLPWSGGELTFDIFHPEFRLDGCDFTMNPGRQTIAVAEHSQSHASAQETNLFRTFSDLVLSGTRDLAWGRISLQTQQIADACRRSAREGSEPVAPDVAS